MNVFVPMLWPEYSCVSQTVSELSAIDAPTRTIWFPFGVLYALSFGLFGWGVIRAHGTNRNLRLVGILIIVYSCFSLYWPPMHLRGTETGITDVLHIVWTIITVVLMVIMMGLAAAALKHTFRYYTVISVVLLIFFGVLTSLQAPNITLDLPTPSIGIWERLNIGVFMIWIVVLAGVLLTRQGATNNCSEH